jgi:hypothetical protein
MKCLRPELKALPLRMEHLPLDERGYPIPAFVDTIEGKRDFRFMSQRHWTRCVREKLCWVCGDKLGGFLAFVIGPMCAITRTTSEPPSHRECARWSAQFCPFLSRPTDRAQENVAGHAILRNPGATCIWVCRDFTVFTDEKGAPLLRVGDPIEVEWWAEGRKATREEINESIRTGLPYLETLARQEKGGMDALTAAVLAIDPWLPQ